MRGRWRLLEVSNFADECTRSDDGKANAQSPYQPAQNGENFVTKQLRALDHQ